MNNNIIIILFLVIGIVLCETIAQSCIKYSRNTNNKNYICISVLFYAIVCFLLYKTYKYQNMGIVNVIWSCLSVLSVLFAGIILYHEKITKNDILGVILILIGLYFIFMDEHKIDNRDKN